MIKIQRLSFLAGLAGVVTSSVAVLAGPATIDLTGTVRDFIPGTHPDFEYAIADDRGVLDPTLPASKNPVFLGAGNSGTSPTIHSSATFDQWFNDVPGVNESIPFTITLNETLPGIYTYSSNSFFPIDGAGQGDYGGSGHNYHFTYELHTQFTYEPGQKFAFAGDDDLWVFVDNQLALDLGGVHPSETGLINLDTLGLTAGQTYDFDLYFAERHTTQSNFTVTTSIALQQNVVPETNALAPSMLVAGAAGFLTWRRRSRSAQA